MKRITALFIASFLLLSGLAAGSGISLDRMNLFDNGPLSFLTRFLADSSSPVTLLNHFMQQEGPLAAQPGKHAPAKPKTDNHHDNVGCLPDGVSAKISVVRTAFSLPSGAGFTPVLSCLAGSPTDRGRSARKQSRSSRACRFCPAFHAGIFCFAFTEQSACGCYAFVRNNRTRPGQARPGFLFYYW